MKRAVSQLKKNTIQFSVNNSMFLLTDELSRLVQDNGKTLFSVTWKFRLAWPDLEECQ